MFRLENTKAKGRDSAYGFRLIVTWAMHDATFRDEHRSKAQRNITT